MNQRSDLYHASGNEVQLFTRAFEQRLPVMLTGPTGCGKTRFVEHMGGLLGRPVATISCHDDLTSSDLVGRFMVVGGDVVWNDGPLTRAVKHGAICYLDEVVEARKDVTVVLHPLTDDRRILPLERTGEELVAPPGFMLVVSYNPGYQSLLKALKPSTRQRFVAIEFDFLPPEQEIAVVSVESGLAPDRVRPLVQLAGRLRALKGHDLEEGVSTRLIVYCATLVAAGVSVVDAVLAGMIEPLTDDGDVKAALVEVARAVIG